MPDRNGGKPPYEQSMDEPVYEVVAPVGSQQATDLEAAAPLAALAGARIGFVWDLLFKGDLVFDAVAEELRQRHPGVEFVGHERFGDIHGPEENAVLERLPELLRPERLDAVGAGA